MDILRKVKLSEIKEKLLPLQGGLWHDWCKKDKKLYQMREKGNRSIEEYKNEIEKEKQKICCEQYYKVIKLNDLMKSLFDSFQSHPDTHTKLYFLQWLSMLIDQLTNYQRVRKTPPEARFPAGSGASREAEAVKERLSQTLGG